MEIRLVTSVLIFLLVLVSISYGVIAGEKKLIYYGWGIRDTQYVRDHWRQMEEMPFDGIGITVAIERDLLDADMNTPTNNQLGWNLTSTREFHEAEFREAVEDLKTAKWQRFTDNFLPAILCGGAASGLNWFNDKHWETVINNFRLYAWIAREGGCKGLLIDPEPYGWRLFHYGSQRSQISEWDRTFAEYQVKAKERGRQLMTAMAGVFPDITLFFFFAWSHPAIYTLRGNEKLEDTEYGLLPAFLDGILEAAPDTVTIVDGFEASYGFRERRQFLEHYSFIRNTALRMTNLPEKYGSQVLAGFGLMLDCTWSRKGWDTSDYTQNYFTPDQFYSALSAALEVSDRYVWIYSQRPRFFPISNLPMPYLDAISSARR